MPPKDISINYTNNKGLQLALRVGITGHRSLSADQAAEIRVRVREVLSTIGDAASKVTQDPKSGHASKSPLLRIISPIAEGADRLVAQEGLSAGYQLQCPLPFLREEYDHDFKSEDSKQEFNDLLSKATAVFELDGDRANESLAYQTVGRVMLAQSDLVIAIWDGKPANGQGGTAQIVAEAASQEIPIIWLQPDKQGVIRLRLRVGEAKDCIVEHDSWAARLSEVLNRLLRLPEEKHRTHAGAIACTSQLDFAACLTKSWPERSLLGYVWRYFVKAVAYPPPPSPVATTEGGSAPHVSAQSETPFKKYYDQTDRPANYFAGLYRGAFLLNYLLGALAVVIALMVVVIPAWQAVWIGLELVTIATIVTLIVLANRGRWHQKSIDCRYYAEQLRQMRYLWPLARVTPSSRPPAHQAFGDPRSTPMNWRFRAALRLEGMPSARVTPEYAANCLDIVFTQWIGGPDGQVAYHRSTARQLARVNLRLHAAARAMFILTAAACIGHLVIHEEHIAAILTLLSAALPATAAAAHAISEQGEFRRLAERSASMAEGLGQSEKALRALRDSGRAYTTADVYRVVAPAAAAMMDEVTDWRILYGKPPIEPA